MDQSFRHIETSIYARLAGIANPKRVDGVLNLIWFPVGSPVGFAMSAILGLFGIASFFFGVKWDHSTDTNRKTDFRATLVAWPGFTMFHIPFPFHTVTCSVCRFFSAQVTDAGKQRDLRKTVGLLQIELRIRVVLRRIGHLFQTS